MLLDAPKVGLVTELASIALGILILTLYLLLTRFPLHHVFLFEDPITGGYGYEAVATHQERRQIRKIQKAKQNPRPKPGEKYLTLDQISEAKRVHRKNKR